MIKEKYIQQVTYLLLIISTVFMSCNPISEKEQIELMFDDVIKEINVEVLNSLKNSKIDSSSKIFDPVESEIISIFIKTKEDERLNTFFEDSLVGKDSSWRMCYLKVAFHYHLNEKDIFDKRTGSDMDKLVTFWGDSVIYR